MQVACDALHSFWNGMVGHQQIRVVSQFFQRMHVAVHVTANDDTLSANINSPGQCRYRSMVDRNRGQAKTPVVDNRNRLGTIRFDVAGDQAVACITIEEIVEVMERPIRRSEQGVNESTRRTVVA